MAELIRMPKMSDTMQQGVINRWLKQVGDQVMPGDILAEVETDKAIMELESYEAGTLLYIGVAAQSAAKVNAVIAIIGALGEDVQALLESAEDLPATQNLPDMKAAVATESSTAALSSVPSLPNVPLLRAAPVVEEAVDHATVDPTRIAASPLAKKMAQAQGYALSQMKGSGSGGRIVKRDVASFHPKRDVGKIPYKEAYEDKPRSTMRDRLAKVLTESKNTAPHFYLTMRIHADKLLALRVELNREASHKISINDLMIKAVALALVEHSAVNAAWLSGKIRNYHHVHMGVAVALEEGLVVPVIRFADQKSLLTISKEMKVLTEKAKQQQLAADDTMGATFTLSNLGMFGIDSFTAIVNPPAACILAIGTLQQVPIVKEGQVLPAHILKVTLSCDHRVVDGAVGASFLSTLRAWVEQPLRLLI